MASVLGLLLGAAGPARADEEAPSPARRLGIGYKLGNGLGFVGADVLVRLVDHLSLDLQANYANVAVEGNRNATGFGLAPAIQAELNARGSTPYLGAGPIYARLTMDNVTASGRGGFANLGYHWRFDSGLGILVGAGVSYLARVEATDGVTTITAPGGAHFNIEAGLRYMFM